MLLTAAATAAIVPVVVFAFVFTSNNSDHRSIAAIVMTAAFDGGAGWALALIGLALVGGIVYLMQGHSS